MAQNIEELQLLISANADQFKSELIGVKQELKELGKSADSTGATVNKGFFGSVFSANVVSQLLIRSIGKLASGFTGLTKNIIESGSAYSRLTIATETVSRNLGISAEAVEELRDDLADANTYGIAAENVIRKLALSGLFKMAEGLEYVDARSGEAEKGVTALTLAMKDMGAANAIGSKQAINSLSDFIQSGRMGQVEGMLELGNLGTEYRMFAQTLGKTRAELTATEEAQARMNIVMREANKVWGSYANTYQTAGKAIDSIGALTQNITEMVGQSLTPVLNVGANAIKQFFVSVRNIVGSSSDAIGNFANRIAGYMVGLIRIIGRVLMMIPVIGHHFSNLANFTVEPVSAAKGLGEQANMASNAVDGMGDSMGGASDKAKALKKDLLGLSGFDEMNVISKPDSEGGGGGGMGGGIGGMGGGIGGMGGGLGLEDSSAEIMEFAKDFEKAFDDKIMQPLKNIKKIIDDLLKNPIVSFLVDMFKKALILSGALWLVKGALGIVLAFLKPLFGFMAPLVGIVKALGGVWATLAGLFSGAGVVLAVIVGLFALLVTGIVSAWQNSEEFRNSVMETWGQIQEVFQLLVGVIQQKMPAFIQAIQPLIDAVGKFLSDAFKFLGEMIVWVWFKITKPMVDFVLKKVVPAFSRVVDIVIAVIGIFAKVAAFVINLLMPVFRTLWEVIKFVFTAIVGIVSWVWQKILQPIFRGIWSIITGLIIPVFMNIRAIAIAVWNKIAEVISNVWGRIMEAIKPVIKWMDEKIMPVVNRIKDGMKRAFDRIRDAGSNVFGGIKNAFRTGLNTIIGWINRFIGTVNGMIDKVNEAGQNVPGWTNISFRIGEIPRLAKGGVIENRGIYELGEAGSEAVMPLERNTEWISVLAEKISDAGNGNQPIVLKVGERTIYKGFVEYLNDRAVVTGKPILNF